MNGDMERNFLGMRVGDGVGEDGRNKGSVDLGGLCFVAVAEGDGASGQAGQAVCWRLSEELCLRPGRLLQI